MSTSRPRLSHEEYLAQIERHARAVCNEAAGEGWLDLARTLRHVHYDGDGCLDH